MYGRKPGEIWEWVCLIKIARENFKNKMSESAYTNCRKVLQ